MSIVNIHVLRYTLINYHFIFCPRYRRKIFLIPNVEERFKHMVKCVCEDIDIEII
ncbi:transposase, partial [Clostridium sp.]|uniref:transposase n=1 Tax=Clostridium sp. TaxID=1506 RepID=UPI003D6CCBFE